MNELSSLDQKRIDEIHYRARFLASRGKDYVILMCLRELVASSDVPYGTRIVLSAAIDLILSETI